ncbi:unnamed protein product [Amoebophrya sp. A25]|nr:unnamed protein product [Amoebophrya sp. A25]|eukprot:GSA25T00008184001.1
MDTIISMSSRCTTGRHRPTTAGLSTAAVIAASASVSSASRMVSFPVLPERCFPVVPERASILNQVNVNGMPAATSESAPINMKDTVDHLQSPASAIIISREADHVQPTPALSAIRRALALDEANMEISAVVGIVLSGIVTMFLIRLIYRMEDVAFHEIAYDVAQGHRSGDSYRRSNSTASVSPGGISDLPTPRHNCIPVKRKRRLIPYRTNLWRDMQRLKVLKVVHGALPSAKLPVSFSTGKPRLRLPAEEKVAAEVPTPPPETQSAPACSPSTPPAKPEEENDVAGARIEAGV